MIVVKQIYSKAHTKASSSNQHLKVSFGRYKRNRDTRGRDGGKHPWYQCIPTKLHARYQLASLSIDTSPSVHIPETLQKDLALDGSMKSWLPSGNHLSTTFSV